MDFKKINISESAKKMELWKFDSSDYLENELDHDFDGLRKELCDGFGKIKTAHKYTTDFQFGMLLYAYLKKNGFTLRDAADDDKWRYLSLCVIPDIVAARWGKTADIRYYKQSGRIWLKTIWWYIYLSLQKEFDDTIKILKDNSTDQILQLVDRIGKNGYFVDAYRRIMYYYWKARQIDSNVGEAEFRKVMVLHTALCRSIEPELCDGGSDGYARMLYARIGVKLDDK